MKDFVDCHCHLFNMVDVPLYATVNGQLNVNSINKFLLALGGGSGKLDDIFFYKEDFIRFLLVFPVLDIP